MCFVKVYDIYNNDREWYVDSPEKGREYAKRVIMEGLWFHEDDGTEVFYPPHRVIKVTVKCPSTS